MRFSVWSILESTHTARHTFITLSLEQGIRPEIIMQRTSHKDIKTMMKYVKITSKIAELEMSRAWDNVPKLLK
jgi:integrase